jgi:fibronectin type 3 domain-containing protein
MFDSKVQIVLSTCIVVIGTALFMLGKTASGMAEQSATPAPHSVTLTWQATPGAKSYRVYRSTVSGSSYQQIGTSPTPNYKDSSVTAGATYYYVVTALSDKGESKYSSEIKAVVPGGK